MKKTLFLFLFLSAALFAQIARDPQTLSYPELRFTPLKPRTIELG